MNNIIKLANKLDKLGMFSDADLVDFKLKLSVASILEKNISDVKSDVAWLSDFRANLDSKTDLLKQSFDPMDEDQEKNLLDLLSELEDLVEKTFVHGSKVLSSFSAGVASVYSEKDLRMLSAAANEVESKSEILENELDLLEGFFESIQENDGVWQKGSVERFKKTVSDKSLGLHKALQDFKREVSRILNIFNDKMDALMKEDHDAIPDDATYEVMPQDIMNEIWLSDMDSQTDFGFEDGIEGNPVPRVDVFQDISPNMYNEKTDKPSRRSIFDLRKKLKEMPQDISSGFDDEDTEEVLIPTKSFDFEDEDTEEVEIPKPFDFEDEDTDELPRAAPAEEQKTEPINIKNRLNRAKRRSLLQ